MTIIVTFRHLGANPFDKDDKDKDKDDKDKDNKDKDKDYNDYHFSGTSVQTLGNAVAHFCGSPPSLSAGGVIIFL